MLMGADSRNNVVLLVHQSSEMYGSDKVLLLLAQGLLASRRFHPVVVLPTTGPLQDELVSSGVEVHVGEVAKMSRAIFTPLGIARLIRNSVVAINTLDRAVAGRSVAVVHSNTLAVLSGAVWSFVRRKKHLWHVHEILGSAKLIGRGYPRLVSWLSDCVMSNSTLTERWLLSELPRLQSRSVVVFNGLPEVSAPEEAKVRKFREYVGASKEDIVVTLAGRINRWKGQGILLDAASELMKRGSAVSIIFVIVGGPAPGLETLPEEFREKAGRSGIGDRVSFLSFVDDIWPVWFGSDIAVVPSTEPEPFGMVAIEAMAAGVPVIASGHGGLLDIVRPEETGILVNPGDAVALADAIARLANDKALRDEMGRAGAERQRTHFSIENQIAQTIDAYEAMGQ